MENEVDFTAAMVDGETFKPFMLFLKSLGMKTIMLVIDKNGISIDHPEKENDPVYFISWRGRKDKFIFFEYNYHQPRLELSVMVERLCAVLHPLQKKKSLMMFKMKGKNALKVSIGDKIQCPNPNHFTNSQSVPLLDLEPTEVVAPIYLGDEIHPMVTSEISYTFDQFHMITESYEKKDGFEEMKLKIYIFSTSLVVTDPLEPNDGFRVGTPDIDERPIAMCEVPLWFFKEFKRLANSAPVFSLVRFYHEEDTVKLKSNVGNYGTLRLYFTTSPVDILFD